MENQLFNLLFSAQGLGALQTLLLAALLTFVIARKNEIKELRKELESLRTELKADSKELRAEMNILRKDFDFLRREFDLLRTELNAKLELLRKAVLLLANQSIDDPERLERIKDLLTI
ncbi:MAG: hypothetical protein MdMp024_0965 [Bacteroidales bacterium]